MPTSEYSPGSILHLKSIRNDLRIEATITHAFLPFTMSPVLRVSLSPNSGALPFGADTQMEIILKLYDRRYLANIREEFGDTDPIGYTAHKQDAYTEYILALRNGEKEAIDFDDPTTMGEVDLSDGEFEAYLAHLTTKFYETELQMYEHLRALQGKRIPHLYLPVSYDHPYDIPDPVPGLLLEYVPSLSLRQSIRHNPPYPPALICRICDDAVKLVNEVNDQEVLNEDVRLDNVLVRLSSVQNMESTSVNCVFIDFSHCRMRRADESEEEWVQAKWSQDEEGAIGFVLSREVQNKYLNKAEERKEVWTYKPSLRYYRPLVE